MGIDQIITVCVTLVVVIAVFVGCFDYIIPMIEKSAFDDICRKYVMISEAENGLNEIYTNSLKEELEAMGLVDVNSYSTPINQALRRQMIELNIEGTYIINSFSSLFIRDKKSIQFVFKTKLLARKIVN